AGRNASLDSTEIARSKRQGSFLLERCSIRCPLLWGGDQDGEPPALPSAGASASGGAGGNLRVHRQGTPAGLPELSVPVRPPCVCAGRRRGNHAGDAQWPPKLEGHGLRAE